MRANNLGGWKCVAAKDGVVHVVPHDDLKPHTNAPNCWCRPANDDAMILHHALDRREFSEASALS